MEPTTQTNIDLIDDIWRGIFSSLDCCLRASLFRVCKRWKSILSNPLCWTTLDVRFSIVKTTSVSLSRFIPKYCTLASKVNIELGLTDNWEEILQSLFDLAHLRSLRFLVASSSFGRPMPINPVKTSIEYKVSNWSNLHYLNLGGRSSLKVHPQLLECIFKGAPNLEELYLHHNVSVSSKDFSPSIFSHLHRLKFLSLSIQFVKPHSTHSRASIVDNDDIKDQIPNLQILFIHESDTLPQYEVRRRGPQLKDKKIESNAHVFRPSVLESRDLKTLQKFGPLLKRSNYAHYFAPHEHHRVEAMNEKPYDLELLYYLFKDLGLDINCNTADTSDPFVADLFPNKSTEPSCPLSRVITDVDAVRIMLDLGADPNLAHEHMSPFTLRGLKRDVCLLLLERGADPLKKVNGKVAIAHLLGPHSSFFDIEGTADIIRAVMEKGVDPNLAVDDKNTLFDLIIERKCSEAALIMIGHGAQWTANSMDLLITWNDKWWKELIESGAFDVNKLYLSTALRAVKQGLYEVVRGCLQHHATELDVNGYSLAHYITILPQTKIVQHPPTRLISRRNVLQRGRMNEREQKPRELTSNEAMMPKPTQVVSPVNQDFNVQKDTPLSQQIKELSLDVNIKSTKGQTPLLLVCSHPADDANVVTTLIECGARVNEPDSNGWTPLHAALYLHKYDTVKVLLSHGANMNAQDKLGVTPVMAFTLLLDQCNANNAGMWTRLLSCADVMLTDKYMSRSIVHYLAVKNGCHVLVKELLENVPELVNCRDAHGFTPLHYAAMSSKSSSMVDMMKLLVDLGADTNAVSYTLKLTPFAVIFATKRSSSPYYRYVQSYITFCEAWKQENVSLGPVGNQINIPTRLPPWYSDQPAMVKRDERDEYETFSSPFEYIPVPSDLSVKDQFGNTCLHHLAQAKNASLLFNSKLLSDELHEYWATPNIFGTTPLHIFLRESTQPYLMNSLADHPLRDNLLQKITLRYPRQVVYSLNNRDEYNKTGLDYIMQNSSLLENMQPTLLKIEGVKFASPVIEKQSSMIHTAINNNLLNVELLDNIAASDPQSLNFKVNGKTPLMLYIENRFDYADREAPKTFQKSWTVLIDRFLALKVDLNPQDNQGNTALHHACFFFHLGGWNCPLMHDSHLFSLVVFKLLDAGARVDIANKSGQTVLDIVPNLLELDRSLVHQVKVPAVKPKESRDLSEFSGFGSAFRGDRRRYYHDE